MVRLTALNVSLRYIYCPNSDLFVIYKYAHPTKNV